MDSSSKQSQNSWYCVFVLAAITLTGSFTIANGLAGMNPITPAIERAYGNIYENRWYPEKMPQDTWTLLLSLTMSMTFGGGLVGSLLVNPLLKCLSRKMSVLAIHCTNSVGLVVVAIGLKAAMSYEMVIIGRFVVGISIGLGMAIIPLVVSEISVAHRRQYYGAMYGLLLPVGQVASTFFAWSKILGSYERILGAILYGLIFTVLFGMCFYWIPETPYQSYTKHGSVKAAEILQRLRSSDAENIQVELNLLRSVAGNDLDTQREATLKEIITTPQYRKHFLCVVVTFSLLMGRGFSNVLAFSDKILLEAGISQDVVTPTSMGAFFLSALASAGAIIAMRKYDCRTLMIVSDIFIVLSHALMTASIQTSKQIPGMSWGAFAALYLFMAAFGVITTATFALLGVLCVDRTRSLCLLIGGAGFWFLAWFVGFISPYLAVWIQGYAFLIWMGTTVLSMVHFSLFVPITKGKTENEIQTFFRK